MNVKTLLPCTFPDSTALSTLAIDVGRTEKLESLSDPALKNHICKFLEYGFLVLPSAIDPFMCDNLKNKIKTGFDGKALCTYWDTDGLKKTENFKPELSGKKECKILNAHEFDKDVQKVIFTTRIKTILELIFGDIPAAFQSLAFIYGSEQPVHDDRTFVVVNPPNNFLASWIALEDITTGSGPLCYYPFSHKLEPNVFKSGSMSVYDEIELRTYSSNLLKKAEDNDLKVEEFYPKKGDVLLWHSALLHGGTVIRDKESTRYSFVTHYCPLKSKPPHSKIAIPQE
jgi:phytanoyl-CoA hydroxylase